MFMKLSEYAAKHGIQYRAAWNRFKAGKIPGAWQDESGTIIVPEKRVEDWAIANGYRVVASVSEVGSGVNDKRRRLSALLKRDDWGTLIVEHKDRLTRFGFEWFRLFIEQQGRRIVVINEAGDDRADLVQDLVSIIYSFSARLYGQRRSKRAEAMVRIVEDGERDAFQA